MLPFRQCFFNRCNLKAYNFYNLFYVKIKKVNIIRMVNSSTSSSSSNQKELVAVCQMTSTNNKNENLETCKSLITQAKEHGAKMVFLPEGCDYVGSNLSEIISLAEPLSGQWLTSLKEVAKSVKIWVSLGGIHEKSDDGKLRNAHVIINSDGKVEAIYRKVHLFDVYFPEKNLNIQESKYIEKGTEILPPVSSPVGNIGLAICYDVRFPEMSIKLAQSGAQILTYPSAFMYETGANHWQELLRARAIENQCFVIAAAQSGVHNPSRKSWGHAMVVDPYGSVVAQCSEGANVAMASIDLDYVETLRKSMPVWTNRRFDLYPKLKTGLTLEALAELGNYEFSFGQVKVPAQHVFYKTQLTMAFVNKKCVLPGHVLVSPIRVVPKFHELTEEEVADLFSVVKKVEKVMEQIYETDSSTLCIQDGVAAGQSIRHVHVHILPRKAGDFKNNDDIYGELQNHDKKDEGWRSYSDMENECNSLRAMFKEHLSKID